MSRFFPVPAKGHMPFVGHRTVKEVRQDNERTHIKRMMARDAALKRLAPPTISQAGICFRCGARGECEHRRLAG